MTNANGNQSRQIHLLLERQGDKADSAPQPLTVPCGSSRLSLLSGLAPQLTEDLEAEGVLLEPVQHDHQIFLMALSQGPQRLRVNGHHAPAVALLPEGAHIQLDEETALHVAIFHRPRIETAAPDVIGKTCPICLTPFTAAPPTTVYHCWNCGLIAHCEGEERPEDERLECIKLAPTCPACEAPVVMTHGYTWRRELNRE